MYNWIISVLWIINEQIHQQSLTHTTYLAHSNLMPARTRVNKPQYLVSEIVNCEMSTWKTLTRSKHKIVNPTHLTNMDTGVEFFAIHFQADSPFDGITLQTHTGYILKCLTYFSTILHYYDTVGIRRKYQHIQTIIFSRICIDNLVMAWDMEKVLKQFQNERPL